MKQIFFIAHAALICICYSCNSTPVATADDSNKEQGQKNIAASDVIMKAFQSGNAGGIDSVVADDFLDHTDRGDIKGKDSLKSMVKFVHDNFADMKADKVREVADGDYVYTWVTYTGSSNGTMGMPKGPYKMSLIELSKFKDGKAIEHWSFMDSQDMAKMMPPPQPEMKKMDESKMKK
ncbi:MAG: ester cyclase [Ginsengibacter sp.]